MPGGIIRWLDMNYGGGHRRVAPRPLSIPDAGSARANGTKGDATSRSFFIKFGKPRSIVKEIARRRKSKPDRSRSRYTLTCYGTALKSASEPRKFVMRGKATLRRELVNQAR